MEGARQVSERGTRQCVLSAAQVEEIYAKMDVEERRALAEWALAQRGAATTPTAPLAFSDGNEGRPTLWLARTLDTGRLAPFHWPSIRFRVIPAVDTPERLFKMATHVLRQVAVPLALANARYERSDVGLVIAVPAPLRVLQDYVVWQNHQDGLQLERRRSQTEASGSNNDDDQDGEDDGDGGDGPVAASAAGKAPPTPAELEAREAVHKHVAAWTAAGLTKDVYRSFSHAVFALRAELDPPLAVLYSITDRDFAVALFRHADVVRADVAALPGFRDKHLLEWPIRQHARSVPVPQVLCQRHRCARSGGPHPDARLLATFETHRSTDDEAITAAIVKELRVVWQTEMEPAITAAVDAELAGRGLPPDSPGAEGAALEDPRMRRGGEEPTLTRTRTRACGDPRNGTLGAKPRCAGRARRRYGPLHRRNHPPRTRAVQRGGRQGMCLVAQPRVLRRADPVRLPPPLPPRFTKTRQTAARG